MPNTKHTNYTDDISHWLEYAAGSAHDPRAVMFSLSVVLAILAQSYDPEPPNAPVSEDELLRQRENLDRRISKWREAIKELFG